MNGKTLLAALGGGLVNFGLGGLFYMVLLASYFAENNGAAAVKDTPDMLYIILGCLSYGLLIAVIFDKWAGIKTIATGAQAGALIGLLTGLAFNFWKLGDSHFFNSLTPAMVDTMVITIMAAGTGAVVGWILGKAE